MAIKAWAALATNELVAHAEVANAVATGQLAWKAGGNPGLAAGYCYTRADFEAYLTSVSMAGSGIASNECMTKAQMEAYRSLGVTVTGFTATEDNALCEFFNQKRVNLTWANPGAGNNTKHLQVSADGSTWTTLELALAAAATSYLESPVPPNQTRYYRITINGASNPAASASVAVGLCP